MNHSSLDQKINTVLLHNGIKGIVNPIIISQIKEVFTETPLHSETPVPVTKISKQDKEKGVSCPTCKQFVKIYRRAFYHWMAYGLILLYKSYKNNPHKYYHLTDDLRMDKRQQADFSKMKYWGLIEECPAEDRKKIKGRTSGHWTITAKGRKFVELRIKLPLYALVYNNEFQGHEGKDINIADALGENFSYSELMDVFIKQNQTIK